jgi:A-kinase anchor protein 10
MTQSLADDEKSKICEKNRKECDETEEKPKKLQPTVLEDALRIYRKFLVTDSAYSVELPATILSKLSLALCETETGGDCDSGDLFEAFQDAQNHVLEVLEREYLAEFLDSSFYCKYTVDVLTSESLNLREILYSESALFFFMEFLEQERDSQLLPYLEFWLAASNFRKTDQSSPEIRSDALVIYEKWFSLQAPHSLNFPNHIRTKLEESICSSDTSIVNCFDVPIQIVEIFLDRSCFKKFVKSQLFFKHLSEVMSKIDGGEKANATNGVIRRHSTLSVKFPAAIRHRRTNSDSKGLPRSISAQNTLLAGLDPKKNKNATDLNIDARQIADPDMLWRRKNSMNRLSFGRVDAFGRFERDFELPTGSTALHTSKSAFQLHNGSIDVDDPQSLLDLNSAQSRFKNAMRKLVHLPEDSLQQEIAWQVAEMIVKDVTNITLPNGDT